jgi:hypothetical protein
LKEWQPGGHLTWGFGLARWAARLSPAARLQESNPTKQQLARQAVTSKIPKASVPRSHRRRRPDARLNPAGFSFALVGLGLLLLAFRPWLFRRGWTRSEESGRPPLYAPFLKVEGDTGHDKTPGLSSRINARGP